MTVPFSMLFETWLPNDVGEMSIWESGVLYSLTAGRGRGGLLVWCLVAQQPCVSALVCLESGHCLSHDQPSWPFPQYCSHPSAPSLSFLLLALICASDLLSWNGNTSFKKEIYLFICLKCRVTEIFYLLIHRPPQMAKIDLGQVETRGQELHPGLPYRWQRAK